MEIAPDLLERIVDHARREAPNECCGIVVTRDGRAIDVLELENVAASPFRFQIDDKTLLELVYGIEDAGNEMGAIYHSHTRSEPVPSQTDMNYAQLWGPEIEWLIVGLAGGELDVRSWRIEEADYVEVEVRVGAA